MKESEIGYSRCWCGRMDNSISQVNEKIDFTNVEKVFVNKYTRDYFAYNDLKRRNDGLKEDFIANIILNNNDIKRREYIYKIHNGGIDKDYYYTKYDKFKIYTYEEVKDGYILFVDKNSKIIAYAKFIFG